MYAPRRQGAADARLAQAQSLRFTLSRPDFESQRRRFAPRLCSVL
eukprot:COSAG02_NODE_4541_length_5234_cov_4.080818_9_plen_45_part_00